jgi:hypothetical protein
VGIRPCKNSLYALEECVKVKFTVEQATKAHRGSRGIAILFLHPQRSVGVGGQCHALGALLLGKIQYPLYRRLDGGQDWSR